MVDPLETLDALLRRHREDSDEPIEVQSVSLKEALRGGDDPLSIVAYLRGLGLAICELDDLLRINEDPDEDELHAFRVQEGIAVSMASDGIWVLYTS